MAGLLQNQRCVACAGSSPAHESGSRVGTGSRHKETLSEVSPMIKLTSVLETENALYEREFPIGCIVTCFGYDRWVLLNKERRGGDGIMLFLVAPDNEKSKIKPVWYVASKFRKARSGCSSFIG